MGAQVLSQREVPLPAPYSFPPSQRWEGNDGNWSTFNIHVGTPEQRFRVLISTSGQETWVPDPEGCNSNDPSNCTDLRGVEIFQGVKSKGFMVLSSSSWEVIGLFELGLGQNLGYTGNGSYGYDRVGLGLPSDAGPSLNHQIVAGIADKSYMLGMFALGPMPTNFSDTNDPQPSFIDSLKNQSVIPSMSFGYTAGMWYRGIPASLTLGGYDAARFKPNNVSFPFFTSSQNITVGLQAIVIKQSLGGTMSPIQTPIYTVIDSTVPEIWLPGEACDIFEKAFGLRYDPARDRYLVNETIHSRLIALQPTITFSLGRNTSHGDTAQIIFPYSAFDLQAAYPIYSRATRYFPLRRATKPSQYTLGRSFLQEAYLVVDWERSNFSVSQALPQISPPNIITITPAPKKVAEKNGMKTTTIIAIIVPIIILLLILCALAYVWHRKRKSNRDSQLTLIPPDTDLVEKDEFGLPLPTSPELEADETKHEMDGTQIGNYFVSIYTPRVPVARNSQQRVASMTSETTETTELDGTAVDDRPTKILAPRAAVLDMSTGQVRIVSAASELDSGYRGHEVEGVESPNGPNSPTSPNSPNSPASPSSPEGDKKLAP